MQKVIDYSLKLNAENITKSFILAGLLTFVSFFFPVYGAERTDWNKIRTGLSKGVNLSHFEQHWHHPDELYKTDLRPHLNAIRKAGFNSIRVPVAFDHFLVAGTTEIRPDLLQHLNNLYSTGSRLGLNMVLVYHYGKLTNENTTTETARIIGLWKQVIRAMYNLSTEKLYFELYNEPTIDSELWKSTATTLVRELRKEDPERIFIIGGTNYNGANELIRMGKLPLDDDKLLYTFHFYEPYIFTHQGADWTPEKTFITGFPYPYRKKDMPVLFNAPPGSPVANDYNRYPKEATYHYLRDRIRQIGQDAERLNLPLICTETGVIKIADRKSRAMYLRDIIRVMKEFGIPVMLWDWNDKFEVIRHNKPIKKIRPWLRGQV
ncbi:MAG TPA: cellulase family glycosylhydrolase [Sediminibacterium sp.]|nr:cellulase family glycosylhydrolase [Sediminibacterium sp.]